MLILSRKKEESLIVNGNIEIKILEIANGIVKIGIVAPKEVEVHRKEIYEKIKEENRASVSGNYLIKQISKQGK